MGGGYYIIIYYVSLNLKQYQTITKYPLSAVLYKIDFLLKCEPSVTREQKQAA